MASPLISTRYRLCPSDPDRCWTFLHTFDGNLSPVWKDQNGVVYKPTPLPGQIWLDYDSLYAGLLTLRANTPPGSYTFDVGRGPELTITVVDSVKRKVVTVSAGGNSSKTLKALLATPLPAGLTAYDVTLVPGTHYWPDFVVLPANTIIRGDGATIRRQAGTTYGSNYPCFVIAAQDVSIYGVKFLYTLDLPTGQALYNDRDPYSDLPGAGVGLVLSDCTFDGCNLGFSFFDAVVQRCKFPGGGAVIAPNGMFYRCLFSGPSTIDAFQHWSKRQCQMVCCVFEGTLRGPVMNGENGGCPDTYWSTVACRDIVAGNNGDECWLCEGGAADRFLNLHCRTPGCESSLFQFDGGCTGALIRDFMADGGAGAIIGPAKPVTNVTIQDAQFSRCGIWFGPGASSCTAVDSLVIDFQPSRAGQTFSNASPQGYSRTAAVWNQGDASNTITRVQIIALAGGFTAQQGFANKGIGRRQ